MTIPKWKDLTEEQKKSLLKCKELFDLHMIPVHIIGEDIKYKKLILEALEIAVRAVKLDIDKNER